jgi:serine/threonine-protein kinase
MAAALPGGVTRRRRISRTIPDGAIHRIDEAGLEAYGVIAEIARGGTSTVYLGHHRTTGERVAIKALNPFYLGHSDMVHRLLGEHELAQRARHPGLLEIRSADQTATGIPYVVMEYLDGENLAALVGRSPPPLSSIVAMAIQVASAVAALHGAGVVHCDLKPENVFALAPPRPGGAPSIKVIDYGVARLADELPLPTTTVVGTPPFMAPEQWRGAPTCKSDVYALGCMLYEMITGGPVFCGALPQLMTAHCERPPPRPSRRCPALDPALDQLIAGTLAKDPALRPTMAELAAGLAELAVSPDMPAAAPHAARSITAMRHRRRDSIEFSEDLAHRLDATGTWPNH